VTHGAIQKHVEVGAQVKATDENSMIEEDNIEDDATLVEEGQQQDHSGLVTSTEPRRSTNLEYKQHEVVDRHSTETKGTETGHESEVAEGLGEVRMEIEGIDETPIARRAEVDTDEAGKKREKGIGKHEGSSEMADDESPQAEAQHNASLQGSPKRYKKLKTDRETSITRERTRSKTRIKTPQRP
jgi:hypothetical protein